MRQAIRLGMLLVSAWWISGCALTDFTLNMPNEPTAGYSGGAGRTVIIPTFIDQRDIKDRIGMKKNNFAMDTASVWPDQNVNSWLSSRLAAEFRSAGLQVVTDGANLSATKIQGYMLKLFIEPVVQWTTVDVETDVSVRIQVTRPDGLEAERRYYVKGVDHVLIALEGPYAASLRKAVDTLMKRVVADFINLLNRFPET